jgi:hypothetical protein
MRASAGGSLFAGSGGGATPGAVAVVQLLQHCAPDLDAEVEQVVVRQAIN